MDQGYGGNFVAPVDNGMRPPLIEQGRMPGQLNVIQPGSGNVPLYKNSQEAVNNFYQRQGYPGGGFPPQGQPQGQQGYPPQIPQQQHLGYPPQGQQQFPQPYGGNPQQAQFPQQQPQMQNQFNQQTPPVSPQGGGGSVFNQLIQEQQQSQFQNNNPFQALAQGAGGQIPQDFVQKGMKLGLNMNQIQALHNEELQKQQNSQVDAQQQKQQETLQNLQRSQETLKLVWGQNFDQNVGVITQYIESQTPQMGDVKTRNGEIKKSVMDILVNPAMAKNMLGLIQQQQGQSQQQQGGLPQTPQIPGSQNQYNQGDQTGMQGYQQDKARFVQMMQPGGPLHSHDPHVRRQAEQEYDLLARKLAQTESTNLFLQGQEQQPQSGFLGAG